LVEPVFFIAAAKLYTQLLGLAALDATQARGTKKALFMFHHTLTSQIAMFFRQGRDGCITT
jgi:hypothetical protein